MLNVSGVIYRFQVGSSVNKNGQPFAYKERDSKRLSRFKVGLPPSKKMYLFQW